MRTHFLAFSILLFSCGCSSMSGTIGTLHPNVMPMMPTWLSQKPTMENQVRLASHRAPMNVNSPRVVEGIEIDRHTTARLQILKQAKLNAPVETVFAYVGDHERMPDWIPLMHRVTIDHSNSVSGPQQCGVGSQRVCTIKPDDIRETIVEWNPNHSFAYRVEDGQKGVPINGGLGVLTFNPTDNGRSTIMTWRVYYEPKKWSPKAVIMPKMVSFQLNGAMKNLVEKYGGTVMAK